MSLIHFNKFINYIDLFIYLENVAWILQKDE